MPDSLGRLGTETAFSVLAGAQALERRGRDIIHLEIGEPDFDTPPHVCDAAAGAMPAGRTSYCPSAGIPELREVAAEYLAHTRRIDVRPSNVLRYRRETVPVLHDLATCNPGRELRQLAGEPGARARVDARLRRATHGPGGRMIAPSEAEETSAAYVAKTPVE